MDIAQAPLELYSSVFFFSFYPVAVKQFLSDLAFVPK